jgi:hypothetical protein
MLLSWGSLSNGPGMLFLNQVTIGAVYTAHKNYTCLAKIQIREEVFQTSNFPQRFVWRRSISFISPHQRV